MEIKKINIRGNQIGIVGLDGILQSAKESRITDEDSLKDFLLQKAKEQNYIPARSEQDYKDALYHEYRRFCGEGVEEEENGLVIEILGPGCPSCEQLEKDVRIVVQELNLPEDIQHIRDLKEISKYGIFGFPFIRCYLPLWITYLEPYCFLTVSGFAKCQRHFSEAPQTRYYMKFRLAINSFFLTLLDNYFSEFLWVHPIPVKFRNIFVCYSNLVFYSTSMLRT